MRIHTVLEAKNRVIKMLIDQLEAGKASVYSRCVYLSSSKCTLGVAGCAGVDQDSKAVMNRGRNEEL